MAGDNMMPIGKDRFIEIVNKGWDYWRDFSKAFKEENGGGNAARELLKPKDPDPQGFNACAKGFFVYCAQWSIHSTRQTMGLWDFADKMPADPAGKLPLSWLMHFGPKYPFIAIDLHQLRAQSERTLDAADFQRLRLRIVLHEIGHMVLHWDKLRALAALPGANAQMPVATPLMEAEAWLWTETIIGIALAELAYDSGNPTTDDSWEYS